MPTIQKLNNLYIENDKWNAPFLLAASFHDLIQFIGSYCKNGVLYWQFSPKDKAELLVDQFQTKTNPPIPAKDLFEATSVFWQEVSRTRNGEIRYEGEKT